MCFVVALRKESVDRNAFSGVDFSEDWLVALRKESVDRNISALESYNIIVKSLSARRAWIEIHNASYNYHSECVALRKESVDRNYAKETPPHKTQRSLSARRAWIEIPKIR